MTSEELNELAEAWIGYWRTPRESPERQEKFGWISDAEYDLRYNDPETLWKLILEVHRRNQSNEIQQVLSAGPVEDLLGMHGGLFIERVESEARQNPQFAKLLGGVWQGRMTDEVWSRLQSVWDRKGWDGIPE